MSPNEVDQWLRIGANAGMLLLLWSILAAGICGVFLMLAGGILALVRMVRDEFNRRPLR